MSRSKHNEAQLFAAVKQMEAGRKAEDVAREVGVSAHTMYAWKSKYGGMDVSEAQEAKRLRDENTRLRKLVADLSLDKEALQSVIEKNGWSSYPTNEDLFVGAPAHRDEGICRTHPERVCLHRAAGLALRRKKRKHCVRTSAPLGIYTEPNQEWALDFVHDVTASGHSIRVLNVIDAYTRESLAMEVDTSFARLRVTRVLDQIMAERGLPRAICCDNGPELTSLHFLAWALDRKIDLVHIQPGKLTQNAYVESFNSKLREECLRVSWFQNLFEAMRIIAAWHRDYNERRPHSSLNYLTPAEFSARTSRGKDADSVRLENALGVSHFPIAAAAS